MSIDSSVYLLRPYPKYGDNGIADRIVFETDKREPDFGKSYYYMREHYERDRNKFIYMLKKNMNADSIDFASRSLSTYSSLSYRTNFEDYYYPMPKLYDELHESKSGPSEKEISEKGPPRNYKFTTHYPDFKHHRETIKAGAIKLKQANRSLERRDAVMREERKSGKLSAKLFKDHF